MMELNLKEHQLDCIELNTYLLECQTATIWSLIKGGLEGIQIAVLLPQAGFIKQIDQS